jgi:class 3 adenylate cyclase
VAVLVVDVVGSTELRQTIGESRFSELRREWAVAGGRVVGRHDGWVVSDGGDGFMAAFGTATSAVSAAVALLRVVSGANRRRAAPERVDLRIGISAGEVSWDGSDLSGLVAVEATRLQSAARPNTILCTDLVRLLARHTSEHAFVDERELSVKGLHDPIRSWQVDWQMSSTSQRLGLPEVFGAEPRLSFVGRGPEYAQLARAWEAARNGQGRLAAVSGEPGVGKTRLCAELARECQAQGAIVLYGRCDEVATYPYQPFVEALRHYVEYGSQLELLAEEHVAELARLEPRIRADFPDLRDPVAADSDTQRYNLFEAVAQWLGFLAREDPVLLVIDDVTWATGPTLDMLHHVAGRLAGTGLLCVVTYRAQEAGPDLRNLLARAYRNLPLDAVPLGGLSQDAVVEALQSMLGSDALDQRLAEVSAAVWRRSGGNPFFVGELFASMLDRGSIEKGERGWTASGHDPELSIPPAVGDVVIQRLRGLRPATQTLLGAASVMGVAFDPVVARQVAGLDPAACAAALDEAESTGLIRSIDLTSYEFSHALVRDVIDGEHGTQRRGELHEAVARAIEARHSTDVEEHADSLALHYGSSVSAEGAARAVWYSAVAGQRASERFAYSEAAYYYRRAIESLERADAPGAGATRAELAVKLGVAQRRAGDPGAQETLLQGCRMAAALGDAPLCARAALAGSRGMFSSTGAVDRVRVEALRLALDLVPPEDSPTRARLLANLSVELAFTEDHSEQDRLSDEATAMARRLGDPAALVPVLALRLVTLWRADRVQERERLAAELEQLCEDYGQPQATLMAVTMGCQAAMEAGDFTSASRRLETIDRIAAALRQPLALGYARLRQSMWAALHGRLAESERLAEEAYEYTHMSQQPDAAAFRMGQILNIRLHQGRLGEILDELAAIGRAYPGIVAFRTAEAMAAAEVGRTDQARAALDSVFGAGGTGVTDDLNWLVTMALAAHAAARLGDRARCRWLADALEPYRDQFVDNASTCWGSVEHFRAMALCGAGDTVAARAAFEWAAAAHTRLDAPLLLAETRIEWSEMLLRTGAAEDRDLAGRLVAEALAVAERFDLRTVAERARRARAACTH